MDLYIPPRSSNNQKLMELIVKTALPLGMLCVVGVLFCVYKLIRNILRPVHSQYTVVVATMLALAWFANIVLFFPFIPDTYGAGFWLPRLILPAVIVD
jgi:hypothetical protein